MSYGWVVFVSEDCVEDQPQEWVEVASKSATLIEGSSITAAELEGMADLVSFLKAYYEGHEPARKRIAVSDRMDFTVVKTLSLADMV